ncbi:hypothetical protein D0Z00_003125 [Geotrichum galactomycetum]|uniref:Uncharacterized protein n=1 Tax=Geotrichum galactomycetum TaxID=27317 RepID=A0ACB6V287_9ASCO|nr:hypothetical protein D0Z00_003125 [Geotrichum candidum]
MSAPFSKAAWTAHKIARAATLYGVSEIIVYDTPSLSHESTPDSSKSNSSSGSSSSSSNGKRLTGYLNYFITPSYLRKQVFGSELSDYDAAQKFPKLSSLPFLSHSGKYLVGISVPRRIEKLKGKAAGKRKKKGQLAEEKLTTYINIGAEKYLQLSNGVKVPIHSRVIVNTESNAVVTATEAFDVARNRKVRGDAAFWTPEGFGYTVRHVAAFGQVFTESPYPDGYKYTAWAPAREAADLPALNVITPLAESSFLKTGVPQADPKEDVPVLLVFGPWHDLSATILADQENFAGLDQAEPLFDGRLATSQAPSIEASVLNALARIDGL